MIDALGIVVTKPPLLSCSLAVLVDAPEVKGSLADVPVQHHFASKGIAAIVVYSAAAP
jgi:hypothetical protein